MKEIQALIVLEVLLMIVGGILGPVFYQSMLCGMAFLPFLFIAIELLKE